MPSTKVNAIAIPTPATYTPNPSLFSVGFFLLSMTILTRVELNLKWVEKTKSRVYYGHST
ncbi:hypothetical protein D3C85_1050490 [compost metagenome]